MRVRWRGLELPTSVLLDKDVSSDTYGKLSIEPFERGFGTTVGNSLRRILLSSLEGSAVTSLKIHGVPHEFTTIEGVLEDVTEIVINIKKLIVSLDSDEPRTITVKAAKAGPVTAGMITLDPSVSIMNPDHLLATLTADVAFEMEMVVEKGRGYVPAGQTEHSPREPQIGVIPIDALFSPVTRVRYNTEETRVGQRINYDRLVMEIWTDGTVSPEMALVESAKILRKHLGPFVQYFELGQQLASQDALDELDEEDTIDDELRKKLEMPIQSLELSVRADNCLEMAKIETISQLVTRSEAELLSLRSFGKTTLREVKRKLADLGLALGMDVTTGQLPDDVDSDYDDDDDDDDDQDFTAVMSEPTEPTE